MLLVNMIGGLKIGDGYQNRPLCRNPKITIQNSDLVVGKVGFPPAPAGKQEVSILFPTKMRGVPHIFVSWRDTDNTLSAVNGLVITDSTDSGFKIATNRIDTEYTWWFSFMAIYR